MTDPTFATRREVVVHHGTPLTPRAALLNVCAGRAMCVSFFRPDDVEAVEAISPAIMFRQRGLFGVARSTEARRRMVHPRGLDALLRLAGASPVPPRAMGGDTGCTGRTVTAQRQPLAAMAVWGSWRAALAHGRADRKAAAALREVFAGLLGLDRRGEAPRQAGLPRADGGDRPRARQPLALPAHDARDSGCGNVSICQRGRDFSGAERVAI